MEKGEWLGQPYEPSVLGRRVRFKIMYMFTSGLNGAEAVETKTACHDYVVGWVVQYGVG